MCRWLKISFLLFFFSIVLRAQFEYTPYKFVQKIYLENHFVSEGYIISPDTASIISITEQKEQKKVELRVSSSDYLFVDNVLMNYDSCTISTQMSIYDLDNDGLDEIIAPVIYNDRIDFLLIEYQNYLTEKVIFSLSVNAPKKFPYINYSFANLDEDPNDELLLSFTENYPEAGSVRGIFAVDIDSQKLLWYYPTAFYMIPSYTNNRNIDSEISIVITSSAVCNGLNFSNETFFFEKDDGVIPYSTNYTDVESTVIDTHAQDYSSDSVAVISALDKKGKKVWEKKLGDKFVWVRHQIVNDNKVIAGVYHRNKNDKLNGSVHIFDIDDGEELKAYHFDKKARYINVISNCLIVNFLDNSLEVYDDQLRLIVESQNGSNNLAYSYIRNNKRNFITDEALSGNNFSLVRNDQLEIEAALKTEGDLTYFPKTDLFCVNSDKGAYLYTLEYVPWYSRISNNTLLIILLSVAGLIIILLILWSFTMSIATKKIKAQKEEIEKTTAKLIESEKLALLGTIAGSVAHELNSPLGAIKNSAQRLLSGKLNDADQKTNIDLIHRAVNSSSTLIQKFLYGSNPKDQSLLADLHEVFNDWKIIFGKQFELLGISIIAEISNIPPLSISKSELNQVIHNLMTNAKDSIMEKKSGEKTIIFKTEELKDSVQISVTDSGTGFDKEMLERAFEPFRTSKETGKGTGLGLWIVKQILDLHNGTIKITNNPTGSTVVINLQISKQVIDEKA